MSERLPTILGLLELTARRPREAVAAVKGMALSAPVAWQVFALVLVLELLFAHVLGMLMGPVEPVEGAVAPPEFMTNPFLMGLFQCSVMVVMTFGVHWVGRAFGGWGRLEDAVGAMALLIFAMTVLQAVEILLILILPALAIGIFIFNIAVFFYLLTMFVAELHGFTRPPLVFLGILLSMIGAAFGMSLILAIIGVGITGGVPNV